MVNSILIVEDEAITALDVKFQLEDKGFQVFMADNADDAFKISDENSIDLVVADINIKGNMNGIEMAERLSQRDIKIIFLSANPDNVPINLKDQEVIYVKKPININDFTKVIESLME